MSLIDFLRRMCRECNGSVVIDELGPVELLDLMRVLMDEKTSGHVYTIAGLAIVTVEGWAAVD